MRLVAQVRGGRTGVAAVARAGASGGAKLKHALTTLSAVSFDVPAAAAPDLIRSLSARQDVMSIVPAAHSLNWLPQTTTAELVLAELMTMGMATLSLWSLPGKLLNRAANGSRSNV